MNRITIAIIIALLATAAIVSAKTRSVVESVPEPTVQDLLQTMQVNEYVEMDELVIRATPEASPDLLAPDVVRALQGFKRPTKTVSRVKAPVSCYTRELAMAARVGEFVEICDTI